MCQLPETGTGNWSLKTGRRFGCQVQGLFKVFAKIHKLQRERSLPKNTISDFKETIFTQGRLILLRFHIVEYEILFLHVNCAIMKIMLQATNTVTLNTVASSKH